MALARREEAWNHTSNILALLANVHRAHSRSKVYRPEEFHPMRIARRKARKNTALELAMAKRLIKEQRNGGSPRHQGRGGLRRTLHEK